MTAFNTYTTHAVISKDGTRIGYRRIGFGPGLILLHGGMMASQNFTELGKLLADRFTVYIPDRRGRGMSGSRDTYSLLKECEDVDALLKETSAHFIFGLSAGALVTLQSALLFPAIRKVAVYEPPLTIKTAQPARWTSRLETELDNGQLAQAMVTTLKNTGDPWSFSSLPRFVLTPLIAALLKAESKKIKNNSGVSVKSLVLAMRYDSQLIREMAAKFDSLKNLKQDLLLLGGSKSALFLQTAMKELRYLLPKSKFVQLRGVGHIAANNDEKPELVADELKRFFM